MSAPAPHREVGMYSARGNARTFHSGQHLQGCVSCYAASIAGRRIPAIGERVIVDATILGEEYAIEVEVVQVDIHPGTFQPRIVGRPVGTSLTTFARTEWREVSS
jgi:hypothetical protein